MVCCGVRDSDEMVAMMPRWVGVETSSLKASCSSFETVIPDCMVLASEVRLIWIDQIVSTVSWSAKDASAAEWR